MKKQAKILVLALLISAFSMFPQTINAQSNEVTAFELIDKIINAEIDYGLSGAQLVVLHKGEIVKQSAYGYTNSYENILENGEVVLDDAKVIERENRNKVTNDTLFDLASNTKMYAGNYAVQYLITEDKLTLDTKVVDIFPDFVYRGIGFDGQAQVTVGHLLRHDSGFIASPKYHDNTFTGNLGNGELTTNWLYSQDESEMLEKLLLTPLEKEPGTFVRYSDVDFMLIGKIVEEISGMPFDEFLKEKIYTPLGLNSITFNPLNNGFTKDETSSSELHGNTRDGRVFFNNYRKEVITGEVHDEKAFYSFDGIAGHAGLFGNATDIAKLAQVMLDGGVSNGVSIFNQDTINDVISPSPLNDTYAYGWRRQGESKAYAWAFSEFASPNTVGHTGWTGTITQIDPDNEVVIALFTNARNSPIMGPDKNDFYTKSFNTNDYGTITTLVYEGLNLGSDISAVDFIINKIESTTNKTTASQKNSVRALYTVLKDLAKTDDKAREYVLNHLNEVIEMNESFEADTTHLDISHLTNVNKDVLNETIKEAKESSDQSEDLLAALSYATLISEDVTATQDVVDAIQQEVKALIKENPTADLVQLMLMMEKVEALDTTIYTNETINPLLGLYKETEEYLKSSVIDQAKVNEYYTDLARLYSGLKLKETKEDSTDDNNNVTVPNTGIASYKEIFAGVLISGVGLLALSHKKHKEER